MNLIDIVEMLVDWKAASERHDNGNIVKSIIHNVERFHLTEQLGSILLNTAEEMWPEAFEIESPGGKDQTCSYCGRRGHWRPDCPWLAVHSAYWGGRAKEALETLQDEDMKRPRSGWGNSSG